MWLGLLTAASAVMHGYFWMRFVRDVRLPPRWIQRLGWALAGLTALVPMSFFLRRLLPEPLNRMAYLLLISWMGILFFLVCLRATGGLIWVGLRIKSWITRQPVFDPARRQFLSRTLATGTLTIGAGGVLHGVYSAFEDPELLEVPVKLDRLPAGAQGFTIVQLTDLHIAPWTPESFVRRVVERVNALRPDLIVVTGDLVDGNPGEIGRTVAPLRNLTATHGVFFVTGNHEYYVDTQVWLEAIRKLGMTILNNSGFMVASAVYLAGIPDRAGLRQFATTPANAPDVRRALAARPADAPAILLAHQPREVWDAAEAGIDLQLSGHTHGGQIWPFGALVMAAQPYLSGLHRHGHTQIYVSRGAGTWGPPLRIGAPAELTKIVLV